MRKGGMFKFLLFLFIISQSSFAHYAEIGDRFNKLSVPKNINKLSPHIQKLIFNSALINVSRPRGINRETGFYIGEVSGKHLFVTNYHVMNEDECESARVTMKINNQKLYLKCKNVLLSYFTEANTDITVFEVNNNDKLRSLNGLKINFNWKPKAKKALAFVGFGMKNPPNSPYSNLNDRKLKRFNPKISMDSDCILVSPDNITLDATDIFASNILITGCDMASGDSGSALIDRETGDVIGLVFGSTDSKYKITSNELHNRAGTDDPIFWNIGSYAFAMNRFYKDFKRLGILRSSD